VRGLRIERRRFPKSFVFFNFPGPIIGETPENRQDGVESC
jgi:hypothetical protein